MATTQTENRFRPHSQSNQALGKLANGATVLEAYQQAGMDGAIVVASYHGQCVTWHVDSDGNAYWGRYFDDLYSARRCFSERIRDRA